MRISDWSSDVCSSDLSLYGRAHEVDAQIIVAAQAIGFTLGLKMRILLTNDDGVHAPGLEVLETIARTLSDDIWIVAPSEEQAGARSEEHTSELQSLMRSSYAVFCLKKKKKREEIIYLESKV